MKKINLEEALFIFSLNASEESSINSIKFDFNRWDTTGLNLPAIFESLVRDGYILFYLLSVGGDATDINQEESLGYAIKFEQLDSNNVIAYLTDSGRKKWENGNLGVSPE